MARLDINLYKTVILGSENTIFHGILGGGGFPRQRCDATEVGKNPFLSPPKKIILIFESSYIFRMSPYLFIFQKSVRNSHFWRSYNRLKIDPIDLALGR